MDAAEKAESPRHTVDSQLLSLAQRWANGIPNTAYFYPRVHPSIKVDAIATEPVERPENLRRRGRPPDHRIDTACARWDEGLRNIADYADLLPPNTDEKMCELNFRSLKSAIGKRRRAKVLAAEALNVAKPSRA
jgi:hypothetical protein